MILVYILNMGKLSDLKTVACKIFREKEIFQAFLWMRFIFSMSQRRGEEVMAERPSLGTRPGKSRPRTSPWVFHSWFTILSNRTGG